MRLEAGLEGAENLAPPGFESQTVQPVASRYTNYAVRAVIHFCSTIKFSPSLFDITMSGESKFSINQINPKPTNTHTQHAYFELERVYMKSVMIIELGYVE